MKEFQVSGTVEFNFDMDIEARNEDDAMAKAEARLETEEGMKEMIENNVPSISIDDAEAYD